MIELTDEIILKIDDLLFDFDILALEVGRTAHNEENIPKACVNDDIFIEYYNGIKDGNKSSQMRNICLPKYIRRELSKNN